MRRRQFITLLGGAAAWPVGAQAQQTAMPVIGLLDSASLDFAAARIASLREGLKEGGFVEGQNLAIEYRAADGRREPIAAMAEDLVRRQVKVIVALGSGDPVRAASAATSTIPIVFGTGADPVATGLVPSLARPGANVTGVSWLANDLQAKQMELLRDLLPRAASIAYLQSAMNFAVEMDARNMQAAARALGFSIALFRAATPSDIDAAFAAIAEQRFDALVVQPDPLFATAAGQIIELAARLKLPAVYGSNDYPKSGGLMSYSADIGEANRQVGRYTARVLKGEKPADLPVVLPSKFDFAINLKTAKALGLTIPPELPLRADEVIE